MSEAIILKRPSPQTLAAEAYDRDYWTAEAMIRTGGGFVKALGQAARLADDFNLVKLKNAFPDYWQNYQLRGQQLKATEQTDNPTP